MHFWTVSIKWQVTFVLAAPSNLQHIHHQSKPIRFLKLYVAVIQLPFHPSFLPDVVQRAYNRNQLIFFNVQVTLSSLDIEMP